MPVLDRSRATTVLAVAAAVSALVATPAASADPIGRVLGYVANNGGGVSVIDTADNSITRTVTDNAGSSPYTADIAFDGTRGYVTNLRDNTLSVIDAPTNSVDARIPVGSKPAGVVVAPDGGFVYVTNYGDGTLSVVDVATLSVVKTVNVGPSPDGVAISPDGKTVYVANDVTGPTTLTVVDATTNTVSASVYTGSRPSSLAVSPDGSRLLVVNKNSEDVAVVDTASRTVLRIVTVNQVPYGVDITADGKRAYVTNSGSNTVSVLNLENVGNPNVPVVDGAPIPVGGRPIGLALTPDDSKVYVTNFTSGTVSVIDTATRAVTATIPVGEKPVGVAVHFVPAAATVLTGGSAKLAITLPSVLSVRSIDARLTEQHTGAPVVGETVVFRTVEGNPLCTAITDATGTARCDSAPALLVTVGVLLKGYTASFPGTNAYTSSVAHGTTTLL
ncbi:beta-propeller fold lactonase family protein [Umezawaea sp. NPDC059074]|uniref:YVTN family beta-propeller repeat protein n=1 Tax=Umezawaea sp. NPDC059074 TaxID=3346716 RepID=UPI0036B26E5B